MSYKEIIDNVSNIEDLVNTTILKVLEKFSKTIKDFAIEQSGLNNLVNVEFIPSDNNTTYTGDSVDYLGTLKLTLSDNIIVNKPCNIKFNIKGSNTIVVDVDEFNNSLELHLDNSVVTTLDFAESERQKSETDGAIVHENQFNNKISNYSMLPSSTNISGIYDFNVTGYHNYTAPANGYVTVFINLGTASPNDLWLQNLTVGLEITFPRVNNTSAYVPCKKGDTVAFYTSEALTSTYNTSKFIYAED